MQHAYTSHITWTGNRGMGTSGHKTYARTWDTAVKGKEPIRCSNDPSLGGDPGKTNPEDLLPSSLSACYMLWYLHLASDAGIAVTEYQDSPVATGEVLKGSTGRFISATLRPKITVLPGTDLDAATAIHQQIHYVCFIARLANFPVSYQPEFIILNAEQRVSGTVTWCTGTVAEGIPPQPYFAADRSILLRSSVDRRGIHHGAG